MSGYQGFCDIIVLVAENNRLSDAQTMKRNFEKSKAAALIAEYNNLHSTLTDITECFHIKKREFENYLETNNFRLCCSRCIVAELNDLPGMLNNREIIELLCRIYSFLKTENAYEFINKTNYLFESKIKNEVQFLAMMNQRFQWFFSSGDQQRKANDIYKKLDEYMNKQLKVKVAQAEETITALKPADEQLVLEEFRNHKSSFQRCYQTHSKRMISSEETLPQITQLLDLWTNAQNAYNGFTEIDANIKEQIKKSADDYICEKSLVLQKSIPISDLINASSTVSYLHRCGIDNMYELSKELEDGTYTFTSNTPFFRRLINQYADIYVQAGNTVLVNDNYVFESDKKAVLHAEGKTYDVSEYIVRRDLFCFYFNSYYFHKKKVQYCAFMGKKERLESIDYFDTLYKRIERLKTEGRIIDQKLTVRRDENILNELLTKPSEYIKPQALIKKLTEQMDELGKGIILIQMERGTGKTAFASKADGLHNSRSLISRSFCRTYHLSNANLRGIRDFNNAMNFSFRHSFHSEDDIYSTKEEIAQLDIFTEDPDRKLAEFLNSYHILYGKKSTVLVLDGVDELSADTKYILECLPEKEMLDDGVFIILLSRFDDEKTVSANTARMIRQASAKTDCVIQIHRRDEMNINVMKDFIGKEYPECSDPDYVIEKADCRFLYLKPHLLIKEKADLDHSDEINFFKSYLDYLNSLYGTYGQNKIKEILSVVALFPGITLSEYQDYLNLPELTYTFIGILNDLMPLFHVSRNTEGNQYTLADDAYRQYVLENYTDSIRDTASFFEQSMREQLSEYLNLPLYRVGMGALLDVYHMQYDNARKLLDFFGKNILNLFHASDDSDPLCSAELFVQFAARLAFDNKAESGYLKVIKEEMLEDIISTLLEGIQNDLSGKQSNSSLFLNLTAQSSHFLSTLKRRLRKMRSYGSLYETVRTNLQDIPEGKRFWWIIEEPKLDDHVLQVLDNSNQMNDFAGYAVSVSGKQCDYNTLLQFDSLNTDTRQKLIALQNERLRIEDFYINQANDLEGIKEKIHLAIDELKDPSTNFEMVGSLYARYKSINICTGLKEFSQKEELQNDLFAFCRAYHQRLTEEPHPYELYRCFGFFDQAENFTIMLSTLFGKECPSKLVEWADIIYRKAKYMKRECCLAVLLLLQAMTEYEKQGNTEGVISAAEKIAYEYDPLIFFQMFNREKYDQMINEIPSLKSEGLYTDAGIALLHLYHSLGMSEKMNRLYENMCHNALTIEEHASLTEVKEDDRYPQFFSLMRVQRQLQLEEYVTEYSKQIYRNKYNQIVSFLETADTRSDYDKLNNLIYELTEYDCRLYDKQLSKKHGSSLVHLLRSLQENADADMKAILENEIHYVKSSLSEKMHTQNMNMKKLAEIRQGKLPLSSAYRFICSTLINYCEVHCRY